MRNAPRIFKLSAMAYPRCSACRLPEHLCLCAQITRAACDVEVVVLRHSLEAKRNSNTGRLVASALQGAELWEYASPDVPIDLNELVVPNTWLLYPHSNASHPATLPKRLIVLDGSWSQARRMAHRIPQLRNLPCLALPPPAKALPRLRKGQSDEQMSTAESVVAALRGLHQEAAACHLEHLLEELVYRFGVTRRKGFEGDAS